MNLGTNTYPVHNRPLVHELVSVVLKLCANGSMQSVLLHVRQGFSLFHSMES